MDEEEDVAAPIRVLVADDNAVIRMGLRQLLRRDASVELVGEAVDGAQALELAHRLHPDVVLLDVRMPGTSGLDVLPELAADCCVLMLTSSDEDATIHQALSAGARGYLVYGTFDEAGIVQSIRSAAGGGNVFSAPVTRLLMSGSTAGGGDAAARPASVPAAGPVVLAVADDPRQPSAGPVLPPEAGSMSSRELEVMQRLAAGRSNGEIATELFLAPKTVKNHINRIFAKLHVTSRGQAIAYWLGSSTEGAGPSGPADAQLRGLVGGPVTRSGFGPAEGPAGPAAGARRSLAFRSSIPPDRGHRPGPRP
jgi:DNA-binding NarL/FixJ family response regulator